MLQFPYQDEPLSGPPPPSLPASAAVRWRPLVPVTVIGPTGKRRFFPRAVLDPGADDTVFPLALAGLLGVALRADSGHALRWRGQGYPLRFGDFAIHPVNLVRQLREPVPPLGKLIAVPSLPAHYLARVTGAAKVTA